MNCRKDNAWVCWAPERDRSCPWHMLYLGCGSDVLDGGETRRQSTWPALPLQVLWLNDAGADQLHSRFLLPDNSRECQMTTAESDLDSRLRTAISWQVVEARWERDKGVQTPTHQICKTQDWERGLWMLKLFGILVFQERLCLLRCSLSNYIINALLCEI